MSLNYLLDIPFAFMRMNYDDDLLDPANNISLSPDHISKFTS